MSLLVYVLNGPNLNLLGKRQPYIYGHETLADVEYDRHSLAAELGLELRFHQSNRGIRISSTGFTRRATCPKIAINPAAFTLYLGRDPGRDGACSDGVSDRGAYLQREQPLRNSATTPSSPDGRAPVSSPGFVTEGYLPALRRIARLIMEKKAE